MKCPICQNELEIKNKKVGETTNGDTIYNEYAICHHCKKQWNLDKQRAKKAEAKKEPAAAVPTKKEIPETPADKKTAAVDTIEKTRKKKKKRPVTPDVPGSSENPVEAQPGPKKKKRPVTPDTPGSSENPVEERPRPKKKKRPADRTVSSAPSERPERTVRKADKTFEELSIDFDEVTEKPKKKKRKPAENVQAEEPTFSNIPPKHIREAREKEMRQNYQMMLDEDDEDEGGLPTFVIVLIILLLLAAAAFAGYWFFIR